MRFGKYLCPLCSEVFCSLFCLLDKHFSNSSTSHLRYNIETYNLCYICIIIHKEFYNPRS